MEAEKVAGTIKYLETCRRSRAAGYPVSFTTDPEWLVDMAVNRRAGWPDDSSMSRGSAMPVNGKFPKRAEGDGGLRQFVRILNGSRWHPRACEVRWLPRKVRERIAHRVREE